MSNRAISFDEAKRQFTNRYTMEHMPPWAHKPIREGVYYAPQYRSDWEWYTRTRFYGEADNLPDEGYCETFDQTYPLGVILPKPFDPEDREWKLLEASRAYEEFVQRNGLPVYGGSSEPMPHRSREVPMIDLVMHKFHRLGYVVFGVNPYVQSRVMDDFGNLVPVSYQPMSEFRISGFVLN